jgi:hypothetical protein
MEKDTENNRIDQTPTSDQNIAPEGNLGELEGVEGDNGKTARTVAEQLKPYQFKKGQSGNPNGRPKGSKDFDTLFEEALKRIADKNNTDPDKFDIDIVAKGLEMARKGDYRFWKDLLDRRFGKPKESIDHTSDGKQISNINWIITNGEQDT